MNIAGDAQYIVPICIRDAIAAYIGRNTKITKTPKTQRYNPARNLRQLQKYNKIVPINLEG